MQPKHQFTLLLLVGALALAPSETGIVRADEVTDWNEHFLTAAHLAGTSPLITARLAAIVQTAVFDALNGIEQRFSPIHVTDQAPPGASRRAAVIQAAYATLAKIFPAQQATFDAERLASLSALGGFQHSVSVSRGLDWGQSVADQILAWRAQDGISPAPPPYLGGLAPGEWRPTPPAFLPAAAPQFATMTPWVIDSPDQFRPAGPPALTSAHYAADVNEVETLGSLTTQARTADQTLLARFWQSATVSYWWDSVAMELAAERGFSLSDNARLLAVLNVAIADASIACWDAKYHYVFWRPITAIQLADTDGNPDTIGDPAWLPLLVTPNFPDYPSGHATTSGAAGAVLAAFFGDESPVSFDSDGMPGVTRSFSSLSAAVQEIKDARVLGGIHFRTAVDDGQVVGQAVANYIVEHAAQPLHGHAGLEGD